MYIVAYFDGKHDAREYFPDSLWAAMGFAVLRATKHGNNYCSILHEKMMKK